MLALAESPRYIDITVKEDYLTTHVRSFESPLRTNTSIFFSRNRDEISSKATELLLKLKRISNFSPNWDSYGAEKPSETAISKATSFILKNRQGELPLYFLAPSPNGEILIELKYDSVSVEVFFMPDGSMEYVQFKNDEVVEQGLLDYHGQKLFEIFD